MMPKQYNVNSGHTQQSIDGMLNRSNENHMHINTININNTLAITIAISRGRRKRGRLSKRQKSQRYEQCSVYAKKRGDA